jgi:hypothetical protein
VVPGHVDGGRTVAGLTDDHDVVGGGEQGGEPGAHHLVVVRPEHR